MKKEINFNELLKIGLEYEKHAQEVIKQHFKTEILNTCCNYKYDFETTNNIKYEVKYDRLANKTNNFFVEYSTYNLNKKISKLSGINKTHSNYYIFIKNLEENNKLIYYIISTKKLKYLIKNNKYFDKKGCLNYKTGIFSNGYLFKEEIIKNNSNYIFTDNYINS